MKPAAGGEQHLSFFSSYVLSTIKKQLFPKFIGINGGIMIVYKS